MRTRRVPRTLARSLPDANWEIAGRGGVMTQGGHIPVRDSHSHRGYLSRSTVLRDGSGSRGVRLFIERLLRIDRQRSARDAIASRCPGAEVCELTAFRTEGAPAIVFPHRGCSAHRTLHAGSLPLFRAGQARGGGGDVRSWSAAVRRAENGAGGCDPDRTDSRTRRRIRRDSPSGLRPSGQ